MAFAPKACIADQQAQSQLAPTYSEKKFARLGCVLVVVVLIPDLVISDKLGETSGSVLRSGVGTDFNAEGGY